MKLYSVMANSVTKTLVVAAISATATAASAGAMAFAANAATSLQQPMEMASYGATSSLA